jgi:hypothetical protein
VRSGLSGAADANGDGVVSYDELRAFVNTASLSVRNPLYRPQVFARAPLGRGGDPIFELASADAVKIELPEKEMREQASWASARSSP